MVIKEKTTLRWFLAECLHGGETGRQRIGVQSRITGVPEYDNSPEFFIGALNGDAFYE